MILQKNSMLVEPQHGRDVAVVLRDVADADCGVDQDRPDRGDEDDEERRRVGSRGTPPATIGSQASGGTVRRIWNTGSRPRIAQIDWPTSAPSSDADDRRQAKADGDTLQ